MTGGSGILEKTQVDSWISYSNGPLKNPASLSACLDYLNRNLTKNWLVSDQITLGDIYVFATLIYHNYKQDSQYPELNRWFSRVSSSKYASKVLNTFNKSSVATKSRKDPSESHQKPAMSRKQEGKFVELPGAEMGKVVVRFPPEASGYLHIGHAKAALLNQYYAETFKGKKKTIIEILSQNPRS